MAPFHSIPAAALRPDFQNIFESPHFHMVDTCPETQAQLDFDGRDFDLPARYWSQFKDDESTYWCASPPSPSIVASRCLIPKTDWRDMDVCFLLSLPKELRLEIWRYVLTDPSVDVAVQIVRRHTNNRLKPQVKPYLSPKRRSKINLNLLCANRFVYNEALPILYNSVKFSVLDLEGIFPLFLSSLPSHGPTLIRHIQMRIPAQGPIDLFHWAITCAQVAKLEALKDVEIIGFGPDFAVQRIRWGVMNSLCKIKAKKIFGGENEEGAQQMLAVAERRLKARAAVREVHMRIEAEERAKRNEQLKQEVERRKEECAERDKQQREQRNSREEEQGYIYLPPPADESAIERDISQIPGIQQFKKELREHTDSNFGRTSEDEEETEIGDWDLVSLRTVNTTPRPRCSDDMPNDSREFWTDTTSTIVDREVPKTEQEDDTSSEGWEDLNEYPLLIGSAKSLGRES